MQQIERERFSHFNAFHASWISSNKYSSVIYILHISGILHLSAYVHSCVKVTDVLPEVIYSQLSKYSLTWATQKWISCEDTIPDTVLNSAPYGLTLEWNGKKKIAERETKS